MAIVSPVKPDHVYQMRDGTKRLVVRIGQGAVTYLPEEDGLFRPGHEQEAQHQKFGAEAVADLGEVDPARLF